MWLTYTDTQRKRVCIGVSRAGAVGTAVEHPLQDPSTLACAGILFLLVDLFSFFLSLSLSLYLSLSFYRFRLHLLLLLLLFEDVVAERSHNYFTPKNK